MNNPVSVFFNTNGIDYSTRGTNAFYMNAFFNELFAVWGDTKFNDELQDMTYYRAHSVFLRNSAVGEESRRTLLFAYMRNYFSTKNFNDTIVKHYNHLASNNLYVLRALNNLAILYTDPPNRQFEGANADTLTDLLENSFFDVAMQDVYRIAKLMNEAAIIPYFNRGSLRFRVLPPDMYRVEYDEYSNIKEFWTPYFDTDKLISSSYTASKVEMPEVRFKVITPTQVYVVDSDGERVPFDYQGKKIQEYNHNLGFAPVGILKLSYQEDTFGYTNNQGLWELVRAQIESNMLDVLAEAEVNLQGFSMFAFINMGLEKEVTTSLGSGRIIARDGVLADDMVPPGYIKVEGSDIYAAIQQFKQDRLTEVMRNLGLPASLIENNPGLASSGVAMQVDRKELEEARRRDMPYCKMFEDSFIKMLVKFANKDIASPYKGKLNSDNLEISIDYVEQSVFLDPTEEFEYYKTLFDNGLITVKEYVKHISQNDNITDDTEAINFVNENLKNKSMIGATNESETNGTTETQTDINVDGDSGTDAIGAQETGTPENNSSN